MRLERRRNRKENPEGRGEREREWVREHREEGKREQVREISKFYFLVLVMNGARWMWHATYHF